MAPILRIAVRDASREALAAYALFIGTEVHDRGLPIPFYEGSVVEGNTLPFVCHEETVVRTAQVHERPGEVTWLERHVRMTQLFVGLGDAPFVMVLGKPNHEAGGRSPDLDQVAAFKVPPGHGVMLHEGTWHDFPMAWDRPVTVLTMSSARVVEALASAVAAEEMDTADVLKIHVARRLGTRLIVGIPGEAGPVA